MNESGESIAKKLVKRKELPSAEYLKECFDYNPETGDLIWRVRPASHFKKDWMVGVFSKKYSGKNAGNIHKRTDGTISGMMTHILGGWFRTHRIIYMMVLGIDPPEDIDHENGNPLDNRWDNIRGGTHQQNLFNQNSTKRTFNRNLPTGVYRRGDRYHAMIRHNGALKLLGCFGSIVEAADARTHAEKNLFGEFAWKGGGE